MRDAASDAAFADAEGEAETPGAAAPSPIVGTERVPDPVRATRRARRVREQAVGAAAERFYAAPPQIERGWGALLIDMQGRAYVMPRHTLIGAVHGTGLYLGIELVRDRETPEPAREEVARVCDLLLGHGFIVQAASERQNVLKVKPPLVLTEADARRFVAALDAVLGSLDD
ncbi:hypothetical protein [Microbacterium aurum]